MNAFAGRVLGRALCVSIVIVLAAPSPAAKIIYVTTAGNDANDGLTWTTAKLTVQAGLTAAAAGDLIWVAAGTYQPDRDATHPTGTGDRTATFRLREGVAVYGGLAGTEDPFTFNLANRDFVTNETTLSGDLSGNDGPGLGNNGENSYHVVTGSGMGPTAILDGFCISGGNANGGSSPNDRGGGMYNSLGSSTLVNCTFKDNTGNYGGGICCEWSSSPNLTNCTFSGNTAPGWGGGGMCCFYSSPTLTNCTFAENTTYYGGGGIYNEGSSPTLNYCTFSGNGTRLGGGIYNRNGSSPTLTDCTFTANSASSGYGGGGMANEFNSNPTLIRCTFSRNSGGAGGGIRGGERSVLVNCRFTGNTAAAGGGMYNEGGSPTLINCVFNGNLASPGYYGGGMANIDGSPTLTNCTFSGNAIMSLLGGGMYNWRNSAPKLTNCVLWGNYGSQISDEYGATSTVTYSCVQRGWIGTGNTDSDPGFVRDPTPGSDWIWGTADDDYGDLHLLPGSPCIDAGNNADVPLDSADLDADGNAAEPVPFDLGAATRFADDPNTADTGGGTAPVVDIGAYEYHCGDVDGSGHVDVTDLLWFIDAFGTVTGNAAYNPACDFNNDGSVDVIDLLDMVAVFDT